MFRPSGWQPLLSPLSAESRETQIAVTPASIYRRSVSLALDLTLLALVLAVVAQLLPDGPPPVDAMAFFSPHDFTNYFVLVALAVVLTALSFVLVANPRFRATPGQYMLGLKLVSLSGQDPSPRQVLTRAALAVVRILLIMLPGPIIALLIGLAAAAVLQVPFSTTDKLLVQAGVTQAVRYAFHSLSFIALITALWVLCVRPLLKYWERSTQFLTPSDMASHTTHVRSEA